MALHHPQVTFGFVIPLVMTAPIAVAGSPLSFQGLGNLPGGLPQSQAFGISADGSTAVGTSNSSDAGSSGIEAFRWTQAEGMIGLGNIPPVIGGPVGFSSIARGVSANGSVIVGFGTDGGSQQPTVWTQATGMLSLGGFGEARGVSSDGSLVVGFNNFDEALLWTDGQVQTLELPPGFSEGQARGISADGATVVGTIVFKEFAFAWTEETSSFILDDVPGVIEGEIAHAASADGSVIVGRGHDPLTGGDEPFRWTEIDGMVSLGSLGNGFAGRALAVSGDGSVIVGASGNEAFVWNDGDGIQSMFDILNSDPATSTLVDGWSLFEATGVSAEGLTIVGNGINPAGDVEAWIATIPEPKTIFLLAFAMAYFSRMRRRTDR